MNHHWTTTGSSGYLQKIPFLCCLLVLPCLAAIGETKADFDSGSSTAEQHHSYDDDTVCSLYLAPSVLFDAGLGIYTGIAKNKGDSILELQQDMFIPLWDRYKTMPYRGNQRFLSWLGYVWPTEPDMYYPTYYDGSSPELSVAFYKTPQGVNGAENGPLFHYKSKDVDGTLIEIPVNAWSPGIASLANSHKKWKNIELVQDDLGCDVLLTNDTFQNPFSPYHGVKFQATKKIPAGKELFLYYGRMWHQRHTALMQAQATDYEYDTLEYYLKHEIDDEEGEYSHEEDYEPWTEQYMRDQWTIMRRQLQGKWNKLVRVEAQRQEEVQQYLNRKENISSKEATDNASVNASTTTKATREQRKVDECKLPPKEKQPRTDDEKEKVSNPIKDLEWLRTNGICLDQLRVGPSSLPNAGRGAFTTRFLKENSVVGPAPLLALRRDDLLIYEIDTDAQKQGRVALDFDKVNGTELLLNYAYGHAESDLLLVPYTPVINYINHHSDPSKVNVRIRWPSDETALRLLQRRPQEWLDQHPLDVADQSGKLMMEFVTIRDLEPGEELFLDYGADWQNAWEKYEAQMIAKGDNLDIAFRHEIRVPENFFPLNWLNQSMEYELSPIEHIEPGEVVPLTWKHNGQHIAQSAFVVGLPEGFTQHVRDFAEERGILSLYRQLLAEPILSPTEWFVFDAHQHLMEIERRRREKTEQWFAQRFRTDYWGVNVHYIGPWNHEARNNFLRHFGTGGFDVVLDGIGTYFGLDSLTCILESFIGVSQAQNSFMHTDIYATGNNTGFNILFPIVTVNDSHPELDIQSDNADHVVAIKYEHDRAVLLSDWGYHRTSTVAYDSAKGEVRVVVGLYCAQMDESNYKMLKHIYADEPPFPFADQFQPPFTDSHWGHGHSLTK